MARSKNKCRICPDDGLPRPSGSEIRRPWDFGKDHFGVFKGTFGSPSPREFGPLHFPFESNLLRIHEERGSGGEEQNTYSVNLH